MRLGLIIFCFLMLASPAMAQNLANTRFSTFYDVAVAYSHMTGEPLNIDALIFSDATYQNKSESDRLKYFTSMKAQVEERQSKFTTGSTPITVRVPVMVEPIYKPAAMKIKYKTRELPYFPFDILGKTITLMPDNLDQYTLIPLDDQNDVKRAQYLGTGGATLVLELLPHYVAPEPVMMNNVKQHIIMAQITRLRVLAGASMSGKVIWSYTDPQFDHLYDSGLGGLYGGSSGAFSNPPTY